MNIFLASLAETIDENALIDFCRRRSLHGTPAVFNGNEDAYYEFRKRTGLPGRRRQVGVHALRTGSRAY